MWFDCFCLICLSVLHYRFDSVLFFCWIIILYVWVFVLWPCYIATAIFAAISNVSCCRRQVAPHHKLSLPAPGQRVHQTRPPMTSQPVDIPHRLSGTAGQCRPSFRRRVPGHLLARRSTLELSRSAVKWASTTMPTPWEVTRATLITRSHSSIATQLVTWGLIHWKCSRHCTSDIAGDSASTQNDASQTIANTTRFSVHRFWPNIHRQSITTF